MAETEIVLEPVALSRIGAEMLVFEALIVPVPEVIANAGAWVLDNVLFVSMAVLETPVEFIDIALEEAPVTVTVARVRLMAPPFCRRIP